MSAFGGLCLAADDGDFQLWSTATAAFDINEQWRGTVEEELRFEDDAGTLGYHHTDIGLAYSGLADWLTIGLNYRQVFSKNSNEIWTQENRPHLNLTLNGDILGLSVANRSRFEYRDRENNEDMWRYRNKTTVKLPFQLTDAGLQPYVADEIFINFGESDISRNRLYSGVTLKLSETLSGSIYYLWESTKSTHEWNDINVLGIQLKLRF